MQADQVHDKGLCGTQVQAAKRQKLDGGLLRKVELFITVKTVYSWFPFDNALCSSEISGN